MDFDDVMSTLEEMGTAQNQKIYARHGVGENMFGVSFGNLKDLKKKIKKDHNLAKQLWATGNHDARNLATMIADPNHVDELLLDVWVKELDNYVITDSFVGLAFQTQFKQAKAVEWIKSDGEYIARAGWHLLSHITQNDDELSDEFFYPYLKAIETQIHHKPNRTREGMNNALIAIGIRNPVLMDKALAAANIVGEVNVDHGDTSCKTPYAPDYIKRTVDRKRKKGQWS